jgi:hypothetical protein
MATVPKVINVSVTNSATVNVYTVPAGKSARAIVTMFRENGVSGAYVYIRINGITYISLGSAGNNSVFLMTKTPGFINTGSGTDSGGSRYITPSSGTYPIVMIEGLIEEYDSKYKGNKEIYMASGDVLSVINSVSTPLNLTFTIYEE